MTYLEFLGRWFNWPYVLGLIVGLAAFVWRSPFEGVGRRLGRLLGLEQAAGGFVAAVSSLSFGILGLTVNGALHDYWPSAQEAGFVPGLVVAMVAAALITRGVGRIRERHFPEIRAVELGSRGLEGRKGTVVSRQVDGEYRAGRAQLMDPDGTLHMVLCKTRGEVVSYGVRIVLEEYDSRDGRYYVRPAEAADATSGERPGET